MSSIKVLMIVASDSIIGGHSIQAREIVNYFANHQTLRIKRYDINANLPTFFRRFRYFRTIINEIVYLIGLFPKVSSSDILHIFSASYWSFLLAPAPAILLGRIFRKRVILNYHSGEADNHLSRCGIFVKAIMRMADEIVVPSEYLQEIFARHQLKSQIVPNSIDVKRFQCSFSDVPAPLNIICTRNFEQCYRVDLVIEAFAHIKAEIKQAKLSLIGDGSCMYQLRELADKLQIKDIVFVGKIDNKWIHEYYKEANFYLNASAVDNMPLSLMEAMAAGLIVVSTASGGIPYLIKNGINGILISSNSAELLARELMSVYNDPVRWKDISLNAIESAKEFDNDRVCGEWEKIYVS